MLKVNYCNNCEHGELMTSLSNMLLDQLYAVKNCNGYINAQTNAESQGKHL